MGETTGVGGQIAFTRRLLPAQRINSFLIQEQATKYRVPLALSTVVFSVFAGGTSMKVRGKTAVFPRAGTLLGHLLY